MKLHVLIILAVLAMIATFFLDLRVAIPLLLLAPYWLGPVAVRLTSRYARAPQITPFRPGVDAIAEPMRIHLSSCESTLRSLGFEPLGYWRQSGFAANVTAWLAVLDHPAAGVAAMAVAIQSTGAPGAGRIVTYTELWSRSDELHSLTTNNSPQPSAFAPMPNRPIERFPSLWDLSRLYRVHQALVARRGQVAPGSALAGRTPPEALAESSIRQMDAQVAAGLLFRDAEWYRPTWKGAALLSWRLLWPAKAVREARLRRRAEALLRELGL